MIEIYQNKTRSYNSARRNMSVFYFSKQGVHFQLPLQINGTEAKQQSSQILYAFGFALDSKKLL